MILKLNKYLKELGIDEHNWLFDKETQEIDDRYKPDEEGFIDADRDDVGYGCDVYYTEQENDIVYKIPLKLLVNRYLKLGIAELFVFCKIVTNFSLKV